MGGLLRASGRERTNYPTIELDGAERLRVELEREVHPVQISIEREPWWLIDPTCKEVDADVSCYFDWLSENRGHLRREVYWHRRSWRRYWRSKGIRRRQGYKVVPSRMRTRSQRP